MKRLMTLAFALTLTGCVPPADKGETDSNNDTCVEDCNTATNVKGAFVSGHLGNYMDCPADGFNGSDGEASSRAAGDEAAGFAPCPEDSDSCGGPLNCEGAQMTIRLTNSGDALDGAAVVSVKLYSMDGLLLGELPVGTVFDTTEGAEFDGTVGEDASHDLRINFQGPADLTGLIAEESSMEPEYTESALVRVTVDLGNGESITIESDELFVLPMVVT